MAEQFRHLHQDSLSGHHYKEEKKILVPRSHSVLHWNVRSPFPLAVGDLGSEIKKKNTSCENPGVLDKFLYGEALRGGPTPYSFIYLF